MIRFRSDATSWRTAITFLRRILVAVYLIETGLLLTVAPWTSWWRRNYFAETIPAVQTFMLSRSAWMLVVTAGVVTALGGVADLYGAFARRADERAGVPHVRR